MQREGESLTDGEELGRRNGRGARSARGGCSPCYQLLQRERGPSIAIIRLLIQLKDRVAGFRESSARCVSAQSARGRCRTAGDAR